MGSSFYFFSVRFGCRRSLLVLNFVLLLLISHCCQGFSKTTSELDEYEERTEKIKISSEMNVKKPNKSIDDSEKKSEMKIKKQNSTSNIVKKMNSTSVNIKKLNATLKITKKANVSTLTNTKKLNSTTKNSKKLNATVSILDLPQTKSNSSIKALNLLKSSKNKTQGISSQNTKEPKPKIQQKQSGFGSVQHPSLQKIKNQGKIIPFYDEESDTDTEDLISEFRDLPHKFHQAVVPDIEKLSSTSKTYLTRANREITEGFRPIVGKRYASAIATISSIIFLFIPLLLVSLVINRFKTYFSIQKILTFIQIYLAIYFFILSLSSIVTGLEPLRFFYLTSQSNYISMQIFQTLGYILYLVLQVMNLILVFSRKGGLGLRVLGLIQILVGISVGIHYYVSVFHRAIRKKSPKTNWKVHAIYALFFFLVCLLSRGERKKKEDKNN